MSNINSDATGGETWYVVEIGVEGLSDKWVLQVYDTGECDPSYTFGKTKTDVLREFMRNLKTKKNRPRRTGL
jgi:hypothetical protein